MFKRLQLVVLGVVVLQAADMSAMENKASSFPKTPKIVRDSLSCSKEARSDSGDFATVAALKRSLEMRKEEKNYASYAYYPYPGGNPEFYYSSSASITDRMKPWFSDCI